jgi:hypothetical protein
VVPGMVYRHDRFYVDRETGEFRRKYFVVLATTRSGDFVARLLTSRAYGRPKHPPCFHGNPYPGFYLGVLGRQLTTDSWVDLRFLEDLDPAEFRRLAGGGTIRSIMELTQPLLREVLDCSAAAEDTTRQQESALRDELAQRR